MIVGLDLCYTHSAPTCYNGRVRSRWCWWFRSLSGQMCGKLRSNFRYIVSTAFCPPVFPLASQYFLCWCYDTWAKKFDVLTIEIVCNAVAGNIELHFALNDQYQTCIIFQFSAIFLFFFGCSLSYWTRLSFQFHDYSYVTAIVVVVGVGVGVVDGSSWGGVTVKPPPPRPSERIWCGEF